MLYYVHKDLLFYDICFPMNVYTYVLIFVSFYMNDVNHPMETGQSELHILYSCMYIVCNSCIYTNTYTILYDTVHVYNCYMYVYNKLIARGGHAN